MTRTQIDAKLQQAETLLIDAAKEAPFYWEQKILHTARLLVKSDLNGSLEESENKYLLKLLKELVTEMEVTNSVAN